MPWVEEEFDEEFRQWIMGFPKKTRPRIYSLLEQYKTGREIYILHSREEATAWLENYVQEEMGI